MTDKPPDKIRFIVCLLAVIFVFAFRVGFAHAPEPPEMSELIVIQGNTLRANTIATIALKWPVLAGLVANEEFATLQTIEVVIMCESGGRHEGVWGKAGEYGIAQFMPGTWKWFNELRDTNLDIYNKDHQLEMMMWAFKNGLENHWTCYRLRDLKNF